MIATHLHQAYKLHVRLTKTRDPASLESLLLLALSPAVAVLPYVRSVFLRHEPSIRDTTFAWNTMIRAHAGSPAAALRLFADMRRHAVPPDLYTFPLLLKACSLLHSTPNAGRAAHALAIKLGLAADIYVHNTLIRFYGGLGLVDSALEVFDEMPCRDAVSWSALIACLESSGKDESALSAFRAMQLQASADSEPDAVTMISVISAVAGLGMLDLALWVHCYLIRNGYGLTVKLATALVVMFANCGAIDRAARVLNRIPKRNRNVRTWTALIKGYAAHGRSSEALAAFHEMEATGIRPDHVTMIGVLTACSHGGLLDAGWRVFENITTVHGIEPTMEHYGCMVDLMGRAGRVEEALEFMQRMPIKPNSVIWRTLLGACVSHGNVEIAEQAKERIAELEPGHGHGHDGDYVLLSNAYGEIGRWGEKDEVRSLMRNEGIAKTPGCTSLGF